MIIEGKRIIAIDPGASGGIAIYDDGEVTVHKMPETPKDILTLLSIYRYNAVCFMEKVHAMPKQGVTSVWNFSANFHHLEMALLANEIPCELITPRTWMKTMGLGTRGDDKGAWKNKLKAKAQQLYPSIKITLWNADPLLILHYAINSQ